MFDQQLTFDGGAEDIAPTTKQDRLFTAPKTMRDQLAMPKRDHEVIDSRKYRHIVAILSNGQRTARWSQDKSTGRVYMSTAWGRADRTKPLSTDQTTYVLSLIAS